MKKHTPTEQPLEDSLSAQPQLNIPTEGNRTIANTWRSRSLGPRFNLAAIEIDHFPRGQHAHETDVCPNLDHHQFPYQAQESLNFGMFIRSYADNPLKTKAFIDIVEGLRLEGNYFLSYPDTGKFFWSTHPTNTEIDLYYLESDYSFSPNGKLPSHQNSVISMLCLGHDLSIRPYQILPLDSTSFNVNYLKKFVKQIKANMIVNLQNLCLIITLPDDVDPHLFYQHYRKCIAEFRSLYANKNPDFKLPDVRVLSRGKLNTRWNPTLLEDSVKVPLEEVIIDKARIELFGKEEYEDIFDQYEKLLKQDHLETAELRHSASDPNDFDVAQFDHFDVLYGGFSFSALCAFCKHLTSLQTQLSILSEGIDSVLTKFSENKLPKPENLIELGKLIRETHESKSQSLVNMKALVEAYQPLLTKVMFELNIPGNKSKSIEVKEDCFNKEIKKILLKSKPSEALLDWYDRSCGNTRYLLNFLMADVGNQIIDQKIRLPQKHHLICRVITQKWQHLSEIVPAITSGCI